MIRRKRNTMFSYPINMEDFISIVKAYFKSGKISKYCIRGVELPDFKLWYDSTREVYWILNKVNGELVRWYKSLGYLLESNMLKKSEFERFFVNLLNSTQEHADIIISKIWGGDC